MLSDEYQCARVSTSFFAYFLLAKLATSSIRVDIFLIVLTMSFCMKYQHDRVKIVLNIFAALCPGQM